MNFATRLSVAFLFLISLFAFVSPISAKAGEIEPELSATSEVPPSEDIHIVFLRKDNYAEIRAIESFASAGGLGTTRITAEAKVQGNRFIIILPQKSATKLAQLDGIGLSSSIVLSPELSKKLGQKGPITLKAGKFTNMEQVKEKRMLWFEIQ